MQWATYGYPPPPHTHTHTHTHLNETKFLLALGYTEHEIES